MKEANKVSSNLIGMLIILFTLFASVNVIMAVRNEPVLLAWLNQIILGTILIAVLSYLVINVSERKRVKKQEPPKKEA